MSEYQPKHGKKPSDSRTPRRTRYRGDYSSAQRVDHSETEAPIYSPPKIPNDTPTPSTSDEGGSGRSILPALLIIVLLILGVLVYFIGENLGWFGNRQTNVTKVSPTANLSSTSFVAAETADEQKAELKIEPTKPVEVTPQVIYVFVTPDPTEEPTATPTMAPTEAPTEVPTEEPTAVPTEAPTAEPTMVPTAEPVLEAEESEAPTATVVTILTVESEEEPENAPTYEIIGTVNFKLYDSGKITSIPMVEYAGGYFPDEDPWNSELEMEVEGSYGPSLEGETIEEGVTNWTYELVKSPLQITRLRVQMGMENLQSLEEEVAFAWSFAKDPDEYDRIANETLQFLYRKLEGGSLRISVDWSLENFMAEGDERAPMVVRGRQNSDDDKIRDEKDVLFTLFDAQGNDIISERRGLINTAVSAKVKAENYAKRAWVNLTEGGTWKWKKGQLEPTTPPTNPPEVTPTPVPNTPTPVPNTPTPEPNTPTPVPNTPTPVPNTPTPVPNTPTPVPNTPTPVPNTPTPRPTKNPEDRPQESDAPVGHGPTNPENSEDPHTTVAPPTSTPYIAPTPAPATPAPTAVPTAVVRPTEVCEVPAPTPIREDANPTPAPEPEHNVPTQEPATAEDPNNTDDFDPDSI